MPSTKSRRFPRFLSGILFLLILQNIVFAHDMYIAPQPVILTKPGDVNLSMFLVNEKVVWFESMTAGLRMIGPAGEAALTVPDTGDPVVAFDREGTYVIGWESDPVLIKIDPPIFNKYIALEGYRNAGESRKTAGKEDQPGREIYTRFVKAFIQVGSVKSTHYSEAFGYKIEIMPLSNPYELTVGSDLSVRVLFDGVPLPDHRIMATYDTYSEIPEDYQQVTLTNREGIAKFRITHKGLWLIRTNEMLPLSGNPEAEWQSFWANFTFFVQS